MWNRILRLTPPNRLFPLLTSVGLMVGLLGYGSVSPMQAERPPNRYDAAAAETRIKAAATAAGVPYPFENPVLRRSRLKSSDFKGVQIFRSELKILFAPATRSCFKLGKCASESSNSAQTRCSLRAWDG